MELWEDGDWNDFWISGRRRDFFNDPAFEKNARKVIEHFLKEYGDIDLTVEVIIGDEDDPGAESFLSYSNFLYMSIGRALNS